MTDAVWQLLLAFGLTSAVLGGTLVLTRVGLDRQDRRLEQRNDEIRLLLLELLMGEPDDAALAGRRLRERRGRDWDRVEDQVFGMLPKVKGDARAGLVTLLVSRGAHARAERRARSRSLVQRARGAHQLGALGEREALPLLWSLLDDHHFVVRRTAVRALGQVGDPRSVGLMFRTLDRTPALARDVLAAVQRIGSGAAAPLREVLAAALRGSEDRRSAALAATGLGLLGDVRSGPLLVEALSYRHRPALIEAAAEALGLIGLPEAVPGLVAALEDDHEPVRIAAAVALGRVGDPGAVPGLRAALESGDKLRESNRAVAWALLRLGSGGFTALKQARSPYAVEAVAARTRAASA